MKKLLYWLLNIFDKNRTELQWWDDIRNGDKKLMITFSESDLVRMSNLRRTKIENLIRMLIAELKH
jgi:hypothetical protein